MIQLSLILASKNDAYCGNPMQRLQTVLNHTATRLNNHPAEIIVTDWGSDIPVSQALKLTKEARSLVRFHHVPKTITSRIRSPFSEPHALNAAAKLARGQFLGRIDQDTLIGDKFLGWFFHGGACTKSVYFSSRRDLQKDQALTLEAEKVVEWPMIRKDAEYWKSAVGILLVPKEVYLQIGGYDEANVYKNHMEHELFCRLQRLLTPVDLGKQLNYDFYHLWHSRENNSQAKQNQTLPTNRLQQLPLRVNEKATITDRFWKACLTLTTKNFYRTLLRNLR